MAAWYEPFVELGYSFPELAAATRSLFKRPPEFPTQHLERIQEAVDEYRYARDREARVRAAGYGTNALPAGEVGTCVLCGDTGWVTVLHPSCCGKDGPIGSTTCAVVCHCWRGRRTVEKWPDDERNRERQPLTITRYRECYPNGERWLREIEERTAIDARNGEPPSPTMADLMDRLAERYGLRRSDTRD